MRKPDLQPCALTAEPKHKGAKQVVTIRLDVDTLEWFKAGGPGYQTRINQLLRDHMNTQVQSEQRAHSSRDSRAASN
jgi:uncharacterized protein (DUF4415 family)